MKRSLSSHVIQGAALLAAAAGIAVISPAGAAETVLYDGGVAAAVGIKPGAWGGSTVEETTEERLDADRTLKVRTRDLYQGVRLSFQKPRNLSSILNQPNAYLSVTVKMSAEAKQLNLAAPAGGLAPGQEMGGGMMPPPMEGMPGGMGGGATTVQVPRISKLRVIFMGENRSLEATTVGEIKPEAGGWTVVGVPLNDLKAKLAGASFPVQRILISADAPDTIYIGHIGVLNDDTAITAQLTADRTNDIKIKTTSAFNATAQAGVTPLKLTWDFDANDGIQEEAVGERVEHSFAKPGRYTVTLTVKPADGTQKEPAVETVEVEVVP